MSADTEKLYCVGKLGGPVRLIMTCLKADAFRAKNDGEVVCLLNSMPSAPAMILADGSDVVPIPVTLAQAQAKAWLSAKTYRASRTTATTAKGKMQVDGDSLQKLMLVAASAARQAPLWSIGWTMADNTTVTHSAVEIVAALDKVMTFITATHTNSESIRSQINAATTVAAVQSIDVTAGYPS